MANCFIDFLLFPPENHLPSLGFAITLCAICDLGHGDFTGYGRRPALRKMPPAAAVRGAADDFHAKMNIQLLFTFYAYPRGVCGPLKSRFLTARN